MRVIAGQYRRRNLKINEKSKQIRPTGDRVKEGLFNILQRYLEGSSVLDLFSGSGALGIEALSRGATHVVFVENHRDSIKDLQENLTSLKIPESQYTIMTMDVRQSYKKLSSFEFDLVFADPPYDSTWYDTLEIDLPLIPLKQDGICSIETSYQKDLNQTVDGFEFLEKRKYGHTALQFYKKL